MSVSSVVGHIGELAQSRLIPSKAMPSADQCIPVGASVLGRGIRYGPSTSTGVIQREAASP